MVKKLNTCCGLRHKEQNNKATLEVIYIVII